DGLGIQPVGVPVHCRLEAERAIVALVPTAVVRVGDHRVGIEAVDERIIRITNRLVARNPEIRVRNADLKELDRDVDLVHTIYADAWEHNWGHVKMERAEVEYLARGF
ncbi:MAG: hypothetical protein V3T64_11975, partial [Myxococcota bacterium]